MENADETFDRRMLDLLSFYFENLYLYTHNFARTSGQVFRRFLENVQVAELFDAINDKLAENPMLKYLAIATVLSCGIPIVMFISFVLVTLLVTFTGFLFIEGTLIAVGGLCMLLTIMSIMMIMSVVAIVGGLFHLLVIKLGLKLGRFDQTSILMRRIGPTFSDTDDSEVSSSFNDSHQD